MTTPVIQRRILKGSYSFQETMHPILQRIYAARGVTHELELEKELTALLPFHTLKGIHEAAVILGHAIMKEERILIVGDFDADGATSTALAVSALKKLGASQVHFVVPNRFVDGYGLTPEIVVHASSWKPDLIITVDNGISNFAGVLKAKEAGIKVVITDHHLPAHELPLADAIVNPNQPHCAFPSKCLAGVGVIFYVMLAVRDFLRQEKWFEEKELKEPHLGQYLDLVALGTVADLVPLDKNNRILVHHGLKRIQTSRARPGIQALLKMAQRDFSKVFAQDLGFAVAPRLNAAGRLDDMSLGIVCLLSESLSEAMELASQLDQLNETRRQIETQMSQEAFYEMTQFSLGENIPSGICLFQESWHQGVIGIVASRIKEKYHRPVIAFARAEEDLLKGSARSISGIHIRDCLQNIAALYPDLIHRFGGHAMAAGLTLKEKDFKKFQKVFEEEVNQHFNEEMGIHVIYSDGNLTQGEFNLSFAEMIKEAEPWGQSFPEPVFDGVFKIIDQRLVGGKHLKLVLSFPEENEKWIDAIAFNVDLKCWPNHRASHIQTAYRLDVNEFRGRRNLQLILEHLYEVDFSLGEHQKIEEELSC